MNHPAPAADYHQDYAAWAAHQALLLKSGQLQALDVENLIEEMEAMSRKEHRELMNRLIILTAHLLKWQFQPAYRGSSWINTIENQRLELSGLLEDSPSLRNHFEDEAWLHNAWQKAVRQAAKETGLNCLPAEPIWSVRDIVADGFYPEN